MNWKILALVVLLVVAVAGCTDGGNGTDDGNGNGGNGTEILIADDSKATEEGTSNLVNANNQFALELYSELNENSENLFFSPWSISSALAMTYEGAKGETEEEMRTVLLFPEDDTERGASFAALYNKFNAENKEYELNTANALWAQQDYPFLEEYLSVVEKYYLGKVTNLDFVGDVEGSRKIINDWVEEKTNDKIKDLIPSGVLNAYTRLVLTNAVYFKGTWVSQFDEELTKNEEFKVSAEETIEVPMMHIGEEETFNYAETDKLQAIELPYEGEDLSMLILLPKENNIQTIEGILDVEMLNDIKNKMYPQEVLVSVPKFKFETKYFISNTLKKMGMEIAFVPDSADFSGMDGTKYLFIQEAIHQAFVEVNEEGTEAAAATAIVMDWEALGPGNVNVFYADHPFIFIIQENETGSILFMGKVVNPLA